MSTYEVKTPQGGASLAGDRDLRIVDCDVHHELRAFPEELAPYLSSRTMQYLSSMGVRSAGEGGQILAHRGGGGVIARLDATPTIGVAGSDPDLAREQLLEEHGISAAILSGFVGLGRIVGNIPAQIVRDVTRAFNDWTLERWLAHDARWMASICVPYEQPEEAVRELVRCREASSRFVQVLLPSRSLQPIGNPTYWPIYEAAAALNLPVGFHAGFSRLSQPTACGMPSYYFESHVNFAVQSYTVVTSLIFEGVLERWPGLKIALAELGWTWAAPLAWRMDATWRVLAAEVAHLSRRPSEYFRDHFWFTSQPMAQPSNDRWVGDVFAQFDQAFPDRLMYSSDYPHWDFDAPAEILPSLPAQKRRRLLGETAAALYGLDLE